MRPLTEAETSTLFSKLANYTGRSLNSIVANTSEGGSEADRYVFRMIGSRVFYVRLSLANLAVSIPRDNLLALGTMIGKFTKTGKFRISITALDVIAPHARYTVHIKENGIMPFLYGGSVARAHVGRFSDDAPESAGIIVRSSDDTPLGFGVTTMSSAQSRKMEPTRIVVARQTDLGEYLRDEDTIFTT